MKLTKVSTHSRPKAAASSARSNIPGAVSFQLTAARRRLPTSPTGLSITGCFNSQPPEGGCLAAYQYQCLIPSFNSQPPEGGCQQ